MKKAILVFLVTFICFVAFAQKKDTFTLESIPTHDEFGNFYQITKQFDHIPTHQDSLNFNTYAHKYIKHNMDSICNRNYEYERAKKIKKLANKPKNK